MAVQLRAFKTYSAVNTTSHVIVKPTTPGTIVSGDLMYTFLVVNGSASPTSTPSGWNLEESVFQSGSQCLYVYSKIAGGSEPADYTWTWAGTIIVGAIMLACYSDISAPLVVDDHDKQTNTSSSNRVWPSITTAVANTFLAFFGFVGSSSSTPDASCTERVDTGLTLRLYLMTEERAASGATGTRTATGVATGSKTISIATAESAGGQGSLSATLDDLALVAVGETDNVGTLSATLDALTLDSSSTITNSATLAVTLDELLLGSAGETEELPTTPTGFFSAALGSRISILLRWRSPFSVRIERSLTGFSGWGNIADVAAGVQEYKDTGLTPGTTYYYRIRSFTA